MFLALNSGREEKVIKDAKDCETPADCSYRKLKAYAVSTGMVTYDGDTKGWEPAWKKSSVTISP